MSFVAAHYCYVPVGQNLNALEKIEFESFCNIFPLKQEEGLSAICNLKKFLNIENFLIFEKLNGGDCNVPILISKHINFQKVPIYVLKNEPNNLWAEKRMKAIEEMSDHGLDQLPDIFKDIKGNYLIKLGEAYFSCIQYLHPDSDQSSSIEHMFMLASNFHTYSKQSSFTEELRSRALDNYTNYSTSHVDPELIKWNPSIFRAEAWKTCVKCAYYFTTDSFLAIYNSLPTQLIHGDITPNNTIISKGKSFFIDLDKVRTDVRLLDFATFLGWSFIERYLNLIEENKLFPCIKTCYGQLEKIEEEYLPLIVLFVRCCVLEWSLQELNQSLYNKDLQKEQQFGPILLGTIREINEICKYPKITEKMR